MDSELNALAERYVRLVLALGQRDSNYVDAYYGPPEWRLEAERAKVPLSEIDNGANALAANLAAMAPASSGEEVSRLRHAYLTRQLKALRTRVAMLTGMTMRFDEESQALYDAVAPQRTEEGFRDILAQLDERLPGAGQPLIERYETFRARFVVPPARLEDTFRAALEGCRARTRQHIDLPPEESFNVEYVTGKSWNAYNWYQGGFRSLIQVNTDLPVHTNTVIRLACHEGYPGHHVYNVLLEKNFVRGRGWCELSVYPLFSPQSLIAEGTADFGVRVAFPGTAQYAFAQNVIFPAAGLDPTMVPIYCEVTELAWQLRHAVVEAGRRYLDGEMDAGVTERWLARFALQAPARAAQQVRFFDRYRSYNITYSAGEELVEQWIVAQGGTESDPKLRWTLFEELIGSPRLPSALNLPLGRVLL
jgi:hypothetical protein